MKKLALAATLAFAATGFSAQAGGVAPAMDPPVIIDDTVTSAGGILVPIVALIMFAAAVAD